MNRTRPSSSVYLLVILLFAECALLAGAAIFLLIELLVDRPASYASAVALLVITALAAVWLGVIAVNAWRQRPWIRGAAVVWQVLQIAVAIGSFQGPEPRPDIGWALLAPAVLVLVLLFSPGVIRSTTRPPRED
ncbi:hypothetical protein [Salinibacterium sp. ZJ454]|uniref:hypothetical protein n=1 Tax=Salinibacterium sp. ZJ454 TaxID=2708339 RepID=UPI001FB959DD|nr:hypothetical protein [Salinibacterium sp. ZJ454]